MCKDWILNPVRIMLRTKLSQRNCSPLTLHNMRNIALFTAKNTYALLDGHGERFFLNRYDGGNHVLQSVSLRVSDRIPLVSIPS